MYLWYVIGWGEPGLWGTFNRCRSTYPQSGDRYLSLSSPQAAP